MRRGERQDEARGDPSPQPRSLLGAAVRLRAKHCVILKQYAPGHHPHVRGDSTQVQWPAQGDTEEGVQRLEAGSRVCTAGWFRVPDPLHSGGHQATWLRRPGDRLGPQGGSPAQFFPCSPRTTTPRTSTPSYLPPSQVGGQQCSDLSSPGGRGSKCSNRKANSGAGNSGRSPALPPARRAAEHRTRCTHIGSAQPRRYWHVGQDGTLPRGLPRSWGMGSGASLVSTQEMPVTPPAGEK